LTIGNWIKYRLDKHYVFGKKASPRLRHALSIATGRALE
jgi:hypothetical protein